MAKYEKENNIFKYTSMDVVMKENPQTISILLKYKIHCVGCLLAPFHSVAEAAVEHDLGVDELLALLQSKTAGGAE